MTTPPTHLIRLEAGPMLFVDCPFCLAPLALDPETASVDCPDCVVRLELADDPAPALLAPAA
jgi:hypothetical protein